MLEEKSVTPDLGKVLEHLDDFALNAQNYETIQDALEKTHGNIEVPVMEKLLSICVRDLKEDMKNTYNTLNVVVAVLKKIKAGEIQQLPDLVPSAVAVLHFIKTTAPHNNVENLKKWSFDILQSYPNDILIILAVSHHSELMEMVNLYCHQNIPFEIRLQPMNIIHKLLKILPPDKKTIFVRDGVGVWFSKIVPTVMEFLTSANEKAAISIETLEMLAEELIAIDYAGDPSWQDVLECVYTQEKYPAIIKNLLDAGNDLWYRIWIIFVKLLKTQITKSNNSAKLGSPINSMLPTVETAFKMNVKDRCRAFLCWNVLIDNFCVDTSEVYLKKRIKLLMIPLTSNNAKVEETVIAKLNTWWHLIRQFERKIDICFETILLPFLHFCFGKPAVPEKPVFAPGLLTIYTKRQVLQAFANIAGHVNCDCTVNMSKLNRKILISNNYLVGHWNYWTNSLTMTIRICVNDNSDSVMQHFKCIWKSFIASIAEVSKITDRHNLFFELLTILEVLLQSPRCDKLADIIFNIVTYSLLDHNDKIQPLLKAENEENNPIDKIVSIILNPSLDYVFTRYDAKEIVAKIKPLTKLVAEEYLEGVIEGYLKFPLIKNNSLMLWTALTETICELKCDVSIEIIQNMLMLPLKSISLFTSVEISVSAWILLYNYAGNRLDETPIDDEICKIMSYQTSTSIANKKFVFRASLAILNNKMESKKENLICNIAEILLNVTNHMDFSLIEDEFLLYSICTKLLLKKVDKEPNEILAKITVFIVNNLLKMISTYYKEQNEDNNQVSNAIVQVLEDVDLLFAKEVYSNLKSILLDDIKKHIPYFKHSGVLSILNSMLNQKINKNEITHVRSPAVKEQTLDKEKLNTPNTDDQNKFTAPTVKSVSKKSRKKDSSIVDTVVDNGEEYVVVKSNWKFNVKKLTDNQKEKLQRTREDIPALYQDLSQSQDEFKRAFRLNSVDSISGSISMATEKEDASEVLKSMACSNVFPKIIENILTETNKKDSSEENNATVDNTKPNKESDPKQVEEKLVKSPRVALKDRVFRNVRNLIEKSGLQKDDKEMNTSLSEDLLKTPPTKRNADNNLINSAPPEINPERPSRMKRKPKKFDELNVFPKKKRRNSNNQNNSQATSSNASETQKPETEQTQVNLANEDIVSMNSHSVHSSHTVKTVVQDGVTNEQKTEPKANNTNICSDEIREIEKNTPDISQSKENNSNQKNMSEEVQNQNDSDLSSVAENLNETDSCNLSDDKSINTPNRSNKEENVKTSLTKKNDRRKSRIEKELEIDMVEGHPFLQLQSEKRMTRKNISLTPPNVTKRQNLVEKLNKSKLSLNESKTEKRQKNKDKSNTSGDAKQSDSFEDTASSQSQEIIESSQESTVSTISVKSSRKPKRIPIVSVEVCKEIPKALQLLKEKQDVLISNELPLSTEICKESPKASKLLKEKQDVLISSELPKNESLSIPLIINLRQEKFVDENKLDDNLTEYMDTQPIENDSSSSGEVIILSGNDPPIVLSSDQTNTEISTQNTANDDTQSLDSALFIEETNNLQEQVVEQPTAISEDKCSNVNETPNIPTQSFDEAQMIENVDTDCSPFKDDEQRKQDFMNNTLEISPIKILSPLQEEKKSPTRDTSSDFVVITLSSPVQSNGEPFEKSDSPEIFSNDKISPDKRDQSPPREEFIMSNLSPSSSLSLKKNRPQVRSGGRAAQMLGLCMPDRVQTLVNSEKSAEPEEQKRSMALNSSARRNLRILYNSTGESNETEENEDSESFLKLKRNVPTSECSPSGPILKRKLTDIIDEATISPALKRKRVSFHDPPVSTTICVKKYIEPLGLHSPQNTALKRQERQLRAQSVMKSSKRLDTAFKTDNALTKTVELESVLTKTVESFTENDNATTNSTDTEMSSLATPIAEVLTTTDLNDIDPICPALIHCKDPIEKVATELSSPAMKLVLIREFEGKIETIGDLARMTEVEINRLCIKAPKVVVTKRVLNNYANKMLQEVMTDNENVDQQIMYLDAEDNNTKRMDDMMCEEMGSNITVTIPMMVSTQTDCEPICCNKTQTVESEHTSALNLIKTSLLEKPDFIDQLCEHLDEPTKQEIANNMPAEVLTNALLKKMDISKSFDTLSALLEHYHVSRSSDTPVSSITQLSVIQNYLSGRFNANDLIMFCSELLKKVYEKPKQC